MLALFSLILVVALSLLIVRIAGLALALTGMSRESAAFQARSAFTGTGFTTAESESVVNHPVRRRIITGLMLIRNAGFISAIAALAGTFVSAGSAAEGFLRIGIIALAIILLWAVSVSRTVNRWIEGAVRWAMGRYTAIDVRDYAGLLHLREGHAIEEVAVSARSQWLADRTLAELRLRDEGVVVIGVHLSDGEFVSAPDGETRVHEGDTLLCYGRTERIHELRERRIDAEGVRARRAAVEEQRQVEAEEDAVEQQADDRAERHAREPSREDVSREGDLLA